MANRSTRWIAFLVTTGLVTGLGVAAATGAGATDKKAASLADAKTDKAKGRSTGLTLPRFASLRAREVNMRAGPGVRYPVEWVYKRRGLPVRIVAEFESWRKVRDWRGTIGWIHRSMLTGRRMAITAGRGSVMRRSPESNAPAVARIEPGVVAGLAACKKSWCRIEAGGLGGWVPRKAIWGIAKGEIFD
jgi:SH3-like domain-containing protein